MKRFLITLALVLGMLSFAQVEASAQMSRLSFGGYKITSVRATGFTSLDGTVVIEVTNMGRKITISNISGIVYKQDVPFVIGTVESVVIPAGTSQVEVSGKASLQSMSALFSFLSNPTIDPSAYTFDVTADVKVRGGKKTVTRKSIPLSSVLK